MRFGLPDSALGKITAALSAHPMVERAVIYGSRAKGTFRAGSDIDLALFGERIGEPEIVKILRELDELDLPWTFDVSAFSALADPALADHIRRVGQTVYATDR